MSIITIATTKGGAGKTTLARLILARATLSGQKAAAIDADLNHTLTDWVSTVARSPITIRHEVDETKIVPLVAELRAPCRRCPPASPISLARPDASPPQH